MRLTFFHPKARQAIREFPDAAKALLGQAILDLQRGKLLAMPVSRPMPSVGPGVSELRVRDAAGIYRSFYTLKSARGVLVFHAFVKKAADACP